MTLTIKEFCRAQHISRMTFYRWLKAGKIPGAVKLPTRWMVAVDSVTSVTPTAKKQ